jgi:hypothetical protein
LYLDSKKMRPRLLFVSSGHGMLRSFRLCAGIVPQRQFSGHSLHSLSNAYNLNCRAVSSEAKKRFDKQFTTNLINDYLLKYYYFRNQIKNSNIIFSGNFD